MKLTRTQANHIERLFSKLDWDTKEVVCNILSTFGINFDYRWDNSMFILNDSVVDPIITTQERIKAIVDAQQEKGLRKYGTSVDDANLSVTAWIRHAQEEIVDLLVYLEKVKDELVKNDD